MHYLHARPKAGRILYFLGLNVQRWRLVSLRRWLPTDGKILGSRGRTHRLEVARRGASRAGKRRRRGARREKLVAKVKWEVVVKGAVQGVVVAKVVAEAGNRRHTLAVGRLGKVPGVWCRTSL